MAIKIHGTIKHIDLEGGFWGITTKSDNYAPIDLPEQLRESEKLVSCSVEVLDVMTANNWGIPCKIFSFTTFDAD